jgi:hypothetical protein
MAGMGTVKAGAGPYDGTTHYMMRIWITGEEGGTVTQVETTDEAEIMQRLAIYHIRSDQQAGDAHLYRLMEALAVRGNLPVTAWEQYRAVYEGRQATGCRA